MREGFLTADEEDGSRLVIYGELDKETGVITIMGESYEKSPGKRIASG